MNSLDSDYRYRYAPVSSWDETGPGLRLHAEVVLQGQELTEISMRGSHRVERFHLKGAMREAGLARASDLGARQEALIVAAGPPSRLQRGQRPDARTIVVETVDVADYRRKCTSARRIMRRSAMSGRCGGSQYACSRRLRVYSVP
jgi:hypothetical protein